MNFIDRLIDRHLKKIIRRDKGYPILYVVYDPTKDRPNVMYHSIDPELKNVPQIEDLSMSLAVAIRYHYNNHPKKLEELKRIIKEARDNED